MSEAASRPNRHELIRQHNEMLVLHAVGQANAPLSRPALATATGLSRPTVNLLVDELMQTGLLREAGTRTGVVGRPASMIEVNPTHGSVAAIALDAASITVLIADITGQILHEVQEPLNSSTPVASSTLKLVEKAVRTAGVNPQRVLSFSVSEPGVAFPSGQTRSLAPNIADLDDAALARKLNREHGGFVSFDNDVNLAALGEQRHGVALGEDSFVFLLVDTGIGMGIMINGELLRGAHGAAGEAGYLPVGDATLTGRAAKVGALELQAGAAALVARYRDASRQPRATLTTLWERADRGEADALTCIRKEADLISRAVLSAAALVDPAFIVLGGAIGSQPLILREVMRQVKAIAPYPVEVRPSALGNRASLLGALATALDEARTRLGLPAIHPAD